MSDGMFLKKLQENLKEDLRKAIEIMNSPKIKEWAHTKSEFARQLKEGNFDRQKMQQIHSVIIPAQLNILNEQIEKIEKIDRLLEVISHKMKYASHETKKEYQKLMDDLKDIEKIGGKHLSRKGLQEIFYRQNYYLQKGDIEAYMKYYKKEQNQSFKILEALKSDSKKKNSIVSNMLDVTKGLIRGLSLISICITIYSSVVFSHKWAIDEMDAITSEFVVLKHEFLDNENNIDAEINFEKKSNIDILGEFNIQDINKLDEIYTSNKSLFEKAHIEKIIFLPSNKKTIGGRFQRNFMFLTQQHVFGDFFEEIIIHELYHSVHDQIPSNFNHHWKKLRGGIIDNRQHQNFHEDVGHFVSMFHLAVKNDKPIKVIDDRIDDAIAKVKLLIEHGIFPKDIVQKIQSRDLKSWFR